MVWKAISTHRSSCTTAGQGLWNTQHLVAATTVATHTQRMCIYGAMHQALVALLMKLAVSLLWNNNPLPPASRWENKDVFFPPHLLATSQFFHCCHGKHPVSVSSDWGPAIKGCYWTSLWRKHRFVNQAEAKQLLESYNQWPWTNNKSLVAASETDKRWEIRSY